MIETVSQVSNVVIEPPVWFVTMSFVLQLSDLTKLGDHSNGPTTFINRRADLQQCLCRFCQILFFCCGRQFGIYPKDLPFIHWKGFSHPSRGFTIGLLYKCIDGNSYLWIFVFWSMIFAARKSIITLLFTDWKRHYWNYEFVLIYGYMS